MLFINANDTVRVMLNRDRLKDKKDFKYLINKPVDIAGYTEMQLHEWASLCAAFFQGSNPVFNPTIQLLNVRVTDSLLGRVFLNKGKATYDKLNELSSNELAALKEMQLRRLTKNEEERQTLIRQILTLQEAEDFTDFHK